MNRSIRLLRLPFAVLALAPLLSHAVNYDPKGLARYDLSYVQCEKMYPQMKGQRDQAYLALWRVPVDPQALGELAKARKSAAYKAERESALKAAPDGVLPASSPINQSCQALWGELQKSHKAQPASVPKKS